MSDWVMHNAMPYDPIKVKVTRPLKLKILRFSKSFSSAIFNVSWQMTTDSETMEQYLTFVRSRFLISPSFCVTWLRTWKGFRSVLQMLLLLQYHSPGGGGVLRSWPSTPYGASFCNYYLAGICCTGYLRYSCYKSFDFRDITVWSELLCDFISIYETNIEYGTQNNGIYNLCLM